MICALAWHFVEQYFIASPLNSFFAIITCFYFRFSFKKFRVVGGSSARLRAKTKAGFRSPNFAGCFIYNFTAGRIYAL